MKEDIIREQIAKIVKQNRIGSSYIFQSQKLSRGLDLAYYFIKLERCFEKIACDECRGCLHVSEAKDPYIYGSVKPKEDIVIGEVREITAQLQLLPVNNGRRFVIFCGKSLNIYAQNSLLKHLEEPPKDTTFIICARSLASVLPTILSRCSKFLLTQDAKESSLSEYVATKLEGVPDDYGFNMSEFLDNCSKFLKVKDIEGLASEVAKNKDLKYQRNIVFAIIWTIEWHIKKSGLNEYDTVAELSEAVTSIESNVNPQLVLIDLLNELFISKGKIIV